jgi:hypothetical protein
VRSNSDEQRLNRQLATPERFDTGRHKVRAGQVLRHLPHRFIAATAASTLSRSDAGSIAG